MSAENDLQKNWARYALAIVRLFNGAVALFAPGWLVQRLGVDPKDQPAAIYVFRMFGIRTLIIGWQLLGDRAHQQHALEHAHYIHASDTLAALLAGKQGHLPQKGARTVVLLSALNTLLAFVAQEQSRK